jgi:hypothetical protein
MGRCKLANQPLETLEEYIERAKGDKFVGKHGDPRRTFDNFRGSLPDNFSDFSRQISSFFKNPNETNLQEIFMDFNTEFDTFADGKNYSPEETIKYKSALFFKLISLSCTGKTDINVYLSNYAQKTSGEFFSTDKTPFMTLDQYYQQIVIPKMMDRIKPLKQPGKNFSDIEISDLVRKERNFDKLPDEFKKQLLDGAQQFLSTQPSQDPVQAVPESFVSDQKSIDNASSSKLTTGEKIGRALVTAAGFIGVVITTAALIGGLSFVAPIVIPAAAAITALTMIGGVLLSDRIPFLGKLFSRKEPQSEPKLTANTSAKLAEEGSIGCTTSQVLSRTSYDLSKEPPGNDQEPVPPTIKPEFENSAVTRPGGPRV